MGLGWIHNVVEGNADSYKPGGVTSGGPVAGGSWEYTFTELGPSTTIAVFTWLVPSPFSRKMAFVMMTNCAPSMMRVTLLKLHWRRWYVMMELPVP